MFYVLDLLTKTFVHAADNATGAAHQAKLCEIQRGSGSADELTRFIVLNEEQAKIFDK